MQLHKISNYIDERYTFLKSVEAEKLYAYVDTENIATIGIGINLRTHGALVLQILGFDFSGICLSGAALQAEQGYINQFINIQTGVFNKPYPSDNSTSNQALAAFDAVLHQRAINPVYTNIQNFVSLEAYNEFHATQSMFFETFYIPSITYLSTNTTASEYLFTQVMDGYTDPFTNSPVKGYEAKLDLWLTRSNLANVQKGLMAHNNKERLALLSLTFNSINYGSDQPNTTWNDDGLPKLLGPKLTNALLYDNRAEAWYEIRYQSNPAVVHTSRRYQEADLFGLYDDGILTTEQQTAQAKEIMRMYTIHELQGLNQLTSYENNHADKPAQTIEQEINKAKTHLTDNFGMGYTIDGEVMVGKGLTTYDYSYYDNGNYVDNDLIGTEKNDLIFGERGNDYLSGGIGNDILFGGGDNDILDGGKGDDTIDGGDGDDTIWGEDGIDNLYGGNDNDTMYGDKDDDVLMGEEGVDFLYGGDDNDILIGGKGSDVLNGDAGDDNINGFTDDESAIDVLKGGTGNDIYWTGGDDIIIDEDGLGNISYGPDNILLTAGERKDTDLENFYVSILDKNVTYRVDGPGKLTAFTPDGTLSITSQTGASFVVPLLDDGTYDTNYVAPLNLPMYGPTDEKSLPDKADDSGKKEKRDPLILDLDGNGIHTIGLSAGTHFDHDGNGFKELTGWAGPGSGVLMLDKNADGNLDSGIELFGDFAPLANGMFAANGFEALAQFDTNYDGKIDNSDPIWSQLKVWQYDSDGTYLGDPSTSGKISSLDEIGISAIYLDSTISNVTDTSGNTETRAGHFEWSDGTTGAISEYRLQRDTGNAVQKEYLEVPIDIAFMPDLQGYGNVYSLQQAMVRDDSGQLKALVDSFIAEENFANRASILDQIIFKWTGADAVSTNARGPFMDGRKVVALEKFYGDSPRNPDSGLATLWKDTYHELFEMFYSKLMNQSHLKNLHAKITYAWDDATQSIKTDMNSVISDIQAALTANYDQGKTLLSEFSRTLRCFSARDTANYLSFREAFISQDPSLGWVIDTGGLSVYDEKGEGQRAWSPHIEGTDNADAVKGSLTEGDGYINGLMGSDVIYGTSRNETLINETGDSILVGGAGRDRIWAGGGNDVLDGGAGNDELKGERGNDTYIFRVGSGQDKIIDIDPTAGNTDTIWIGSNLTPDDITLRRSANNLIVKINNTTDTLTVQDFFKNNSSLYRIEQIQFMDGTIWDVDEMYYRSSLPTESNDIIYGSTGDDILHGLGGNDSIFGRNGNDLLFGDTGNDKLYGEDGEDILDGGEGADYLYGGSGNDTLLGNSSYDKLYGGSGEDTLDGGEGIDFLDGSTGNDTYIFKRGNGQDTISDTDTTVGNIDTVIFGEDILPSDIKVERYWSNDIKLSIIGTSDYLLVKNCILNNQKDYRTVVEQFKFTDGTVWNGDTIKDFILTGTDANDTIQGFSGQDTIQGMAGNDSLYSKEGNDILDGGAGNDSLYGGTNYYSNKANGDDTYIFGRGSGQDVIYDRDVTLGNSDTILLAADILPDDVQLIRLAYSDDLVLSIKDTNDTIKVRNWFYDESGEWQVERIQFADGTVWDVDTIKIKVLLGTDANDKLRGYDTDDIISGYDGNDTLFGRTGDDVISGGAGKDRLSGEVGNDTLFGDDGNDYIEGGSGNDVLHGGAGDDRLYGGSGNDILSGDEGYDTLEGGEGSDTFIFKAGSGQNVIRGYDNEVSSIDTILIDEGITTDAIFIHRNWDNLVVTNKDTGDSMTVEYWFIDEGNEGNRIDKVQFSDGTVWDVAMLKELALVGTSETDSLTGYSTDDIMDGKEGDDVLTGKAGNDTYIFGRGYGQDVIYEDYDSSGAYIGWDFEVTPDDITLDQVGNNLVVLPHIMNNSQNSNMHHILFS